MKKISVRMITHVAFLIALEIVLNRFVSINTMSVKIGFAFVPVAICGMLYGPFWAALVASVADVIGAVFLNPMPSPYFPPITITAALMGITFGLLLHHKRNPSLLHTTIAAAVSNFVLSLCLQSYWLTFLTGNPYSVQFTMRIFQAVVIFCVQAVMLPILLKMSTSLNRHFSFYEVPVGT